MPSAFRKLVVIGFVSLFVATLPVQAQTRIDVGCTPTALVSAINAANSTPEADTLNLPPSCDYMLDEETVLPPITSTIIINGNDATLTHVGSFAFSLLEVGSGGSLTLNDVTITSGWAAAGGGIYNDGGTLTVTNSTISGNRATSGGGIYNYFGTLTVTDSTLSGNWGSPGGGIYNYFGTLTVIGSTLSDNLAFNDWGCGCDPHANTDGEGGGIYNYNGTATVTNSTLSGNSAVDGGGIISVGTLTVTNSPIVGNSAGGDGGGIFIWGGTATVTNSMLSGNLAILGGGISSYGTLTVTNSTVVGNTHKGDVSAGGGICTAYGGMATVTNSIVWGNQIPQIGGCPGTSVSVSYSIVEGGYAGTGNLDANPMFVNPRPFGEAPTTAGNYHLRPGSPALNVGSNAAMTLDPTDLDGDGDTTEPLPYDRDNTARVKAVIVDMGAYEGAGWELLINYDFEINLDANNIPDAWTVKSAADDKGKCNSLDKIVSFTGNCAFKFAGSADEATKLIQNVDLIGGKFTFTKGDALLLSAFFRGGNPAVSAKFIVKVAYVGNSTPQKESVSIDPKVGYTEVIVPDLVLTDSAVEQIKVMVKHKSAEGKLYIDSVSLRQALPSAARGALLPPPAAPDGMRGFN